MQPSRDGDRSLSVRLLLVGLVCAFSSIACSPQNEGSRPPGSVTAAPATETPRVPGPGGLPAPPSAYLKDSSGKAVEGFTGTYCWQQGQQGGMCVDYSPWGTSKALIPLRAGQPLEFVFDAGQPREAKVRWLAVDKATPRDHGDSFDWTPQDYKPGEMAATLAAPADPGRYALEVFTLFREGDVTYGFYVEVR